MSEAGEVRKIYTAMLSGKDSNGTPFSCQVDLSPMSGEFPDGFWTDLLNALVDVEILTEEELDGETKDTP